MFLRRACQQYSLETLNAGETHAYSLYFVPISVIAGISYLHATEYKIRYQAKP